MIRLSKGGVALHFPLSFQFDHADERHASFPFCGIKTFGGIATPAA